MPFFVYNLIHCKYHILLNHYSKFMFYKQPISLLFKFCHKYRKKIKTIIQIVETQGRKSKGKLSNEAFFNYERTLVIRTFKKRNFFFELHELYITMVY